MFDQDLSDPYASSKRDQWESPSGLIECASRRCLRVIWKFHLPPKHNNARSSPAPVGAHIGKEIIRNYGQATAIANEIVDVQEHPHQEAKEASRVNRPGLDHGIGTT